MPDLWDTNPDRVFNPPNTPPDLTQGDQDHAEVRLKNDGGRLRLPAFVLIALAVALAAVMVSIVAVLAGFT
jgi:hypothetical protein